MPYQWDNRLKRFRDKVTGRIAPEATVRAGVEQAIDNGRLEVRASVSALAAGRTTLPDWQRDLRNAARDAHLAVGAVAAGGLRQLTNQALGKIGAYVKQEYKGIAALAASVQELSPAQVAVRAGYYVGSAIRTFEAVYQDVRSEAGATECMNILQPGASCSDCIRLSSMGYIPIGDMPLPGTRDCRSNCNCRLKYR